VRVLVGARARACSCARARAFSSVRLPAWLTGARSSVMSERPCAQKAINVAKQRNPLHIYSVFCLDHFGG
jgi:hypothetical protein